MQRLLVGSERSTVRAVFYCVTHHVVHAGTGVCSEVVLQVALMDAAVRKKVSESGALGFGGECKGLGVLST